MIQYEFSFLGSQGYREIKSPNCHSMQLLRPVFYVFEGKNIFKIEKSHDIKLKNGNFCIKNYWQFKTNYLLHFKIQCMYIVRLKDLYPLVRLIKSLLATTHSGRFIWTNPKIKTVTVKKIPDTVVFYYCVWYLFNCNTL